MVCEASRSGRCGTTKVYIDAFSQSRAFIQSLQRPSNGALKRYMKEIKKQGGSLPGFSQDSQLRSLHTMSQQESWARELIEGGRVARYLTVWCYFSLLLEYPC